MKNLKKISYALLFGIGVLVCVMVLLFVFKGNDANNLNYLTSNLVASNLAGEVVVSESDNTDGFKALAAGLAIGMAALGGTIAMGLAVAKASDSISRQPEAEGKIRSAFMLGLVFIETVVIYALIVGILIIFVL